MVWKKEHAIILIIKITEVLGFSLILPFLPFYAQTLGASVFVVGLVLTAFSLFQFISAPIMGRLSDTYGRRPLLILSQLSTFLSFIVLGFANSLWLLFLSRIIDGLLGSNETIAQAYLSDITPHKDRTKIFSISGIAFSIGFFIGPALGGYLSKFSYSLPSFIAAGVVCLTMVLTYFFLPETVNKQTQFSWSWDIFKLQNLNLLKSKSQFSVPLWEFFFYVLTHGVWISSFALYAERQLSFNTQDVGFLLTIIGIVTIFIRGLILPYLLNTVDEQKLRILGATVILTTLLSTPFIHSKLMMIILTVVFAFGASILRPSLVSRLSRLATDQQQGTMMGVTSSLASISQIVGPLLGGFLIQNFFPGSLGLAAAGFMFLGWLMLVRDLRLETTK